MSALLEKLDAFRPNIITAENVSGEQCDQLGRYSTTYPGSYDAWCVSPELARRAIGMDGPTAAGEVDKELSKWPTNPTPANRRHLAALFLAVGDAPSARDQWLRLELSERHTGDGITEQTLKLVERVGSRPNETYEIAAALAARLGLERVYLVDDLADPPISLTRFATSNSPKRPSRNAAACASIQRAKSCSYPAGSVGCILVQV